MALRLLAGTLAPDELRMPTDIRGSAILQCRHRRGRITGMVSARDIAESSITAVLGTEIRGY